MLALSPLATERLAGGGPPLAGALVAAGAQPSKGAARRLIWPGGVYANDRRAAHPGRALTPDDALFGRAVLLLAE